MQTRLHASPAKSFAMKTIGEQAKAFREARGWSPKEMAAACKTSRQNIETLEAKGARTPRYIKDLARVMGTTVDVLMEGRYEMGAIAVQAPIAQVEAAPSHDKVTRALEVLAAALRPADKVTRSAVAPLLSLLAAEPEQLKNVAAAVKKLLPAAEVARNPQDDRSTDLEFDLDTSKFGHGKSNRIQGSSR